MNIDIKIVSFCCYTFRRFLSLFSINFLVVPFGRRANSYARLTYEVMVIVVLRRTSQQGCARVAPRLAG